MLGKKLEKKTEVETENENKKVAEKLEMRLIEKQYELADYTAKKGTIVVI